MPGNCLVWSHHLDPANISLKRRKKTKQDYWSRLWMKCRKNLLMTLHVSGIYFYLDHFVINICKLTKLISWKKTPLKNSLKASARIGTTPPAEYSMVHIGGHCRLHLYFQWQLLYRLSKSHCCWTIHMNIPICIVVYHWAKPNTK